MCNIYDEETALYYWKKMFSLLFSLDCCVYQIKKCRKRQDSFRVCSFYIHGKEHTERCAIIKGKLKCDLKGTVMQIGKALINDRSRVSKVAGKFHIPTIYNFAVIYLWKLLFFLKVVNFLIVSIVIYICKQNVLDELLKVRTVMNTKIFEFVICVEEVINLLLFNLHDIPLIPYQTS